MHRRSPSGQEEPLLTLDTRVPNYAATDGSTRTLSQKTFQWLVLSGVLAAPADLNLPLNPKDGDEVWVKDTHTGAAVLNINGNTRNIDAGPTDALAATVFDARLYKYVLSEDIWLTFVEG